MFNPVPSLTETGWLEDPFKAGGQLFAYFLESEYSQSNEYYGQIHSMPYIVQQYGGQPPDLCTKINSALTSLFSRYFTTDSNAGDIRVNTTHNATTEITRYNFTIDLSWKVSGITYQLGRVVTIDGSVIASVIDAYNN